MNVTHLTAQYRAFEAHLDELTKQQVKHEAHYFVEYTVLDHERSKLLPEWAIDKIEGTAPKYWISLGLKQIQMYILRVALVSVVVGDGPDVEALEIMAYNPVTGYMTKIRLKDFDYTEDKLNLLSRL